MQYRVTAKIEFEGEEFVRTWTVFAYSEYRALNKVREVLRHTYMPTIDILYLEAEQVH